MLNNIYQKLISGRYLGEILRLVICELIDEGVLFLGQNTYKLENPYVFDTAFLSLMERSVSVPPSLSSLILIVTCSDPTDELLMIIGIFSHFFAVETTLAERQFFRALAKLIGRRAARLSACGIAAIVSKMGYLDEGCAVGADGSLYNASPLSIVHLHWCWFSLLSASFSRNIRSLRIGYMRVWWIYLGRRDGECSAYLPWFFPTVLIDHGFRNIVTHHAEDGSGVGSAIIAGQ